MSVHLLVERLASYGCRQVPGRESWRSRCPAHGGSKENLYVDVKGGPGGAKVLLHCFAGCDASDVLSAVGLRWRDIDSSIQSPMYDSLEDRLVVKIAEADIAAGRQLTQGDLERYRKALYRLRRAAA